MGYVVFGERIRQGKNKTRIGLSILLKFLMLTRPFPFSAPQTHPLKIPSWGLDCLLTIHTQHLGFFLASSSPSIPDVSSQLLVMIPSPPSPNMRMQLARSKPPQNKSKVWDYLPVPAPLIRLEGRPIRRNVIPLVGTYS